MVSYAMQKNWLIILSKKDQKPNRNHTWIGQFIDSKVAQHIFNKLIAQVFQAVRIEVNEELDVIKSFLEQSIELLNLGGRLACISYHSLEDRLVKVFIREGKFAGKQNQIYGNRNLSLKKVGNLQIPSDEEIMDNNRSRSGKLRIAERI